MSVMTEYVFGWIIAIALMGIAVWAGPYLREIIGGPDLIGLLLILWCAGIVGTAYYAWRFLVSLCETFCSHD